MSMMQGESTIISYADSGGISLYSVPPPEGATVGGSNMPDEGSTGSITRVRWWIYKDETTGAYSGGITGMGWFRSTDENRSTVPGPFEELKDEEIYQYVVTDGHGNLDYYFDQWNTNTPDVDILTFQLDVLRIAGEGCITVGDMQG